MLGVEHGTLLEELPTPTLNPRSELGVEVRQVSRRTFVDEARSLIGTKLLEFGRSQNRAGLHVGTLPGEVPQDQAFDPPVCYEIHRGPSRARQARLSGR